MAQPDKLRVLYDALNNQYNLGTFDEFKTKMQDEKKRRAFYDGVSSAYNLGSFDEFNGKIASSFATAQPTAQPQGAEATVDNSVENSQQQQPEQPKWTPTPVQRMGMQMQLDEISRRSKQTMDDFNESMENIRSVQPITMRSKPRVKFNSTTGKVETTYGALDGRSYSSPELAQQASRKHQAEWVENWENTTEEGRQHRERRIQQQEQDFQDFVNGTSLMFRNDRNNSAEKAWADAAERTAAENERSANKVYGGDPWLNGGREMHIVNASLYSNEKRANYLREHDLDKLFDEAWNNLGEDGQANAIEDAFLHLKSHYPGADEQQLQQAARELARQQSDRRMYYLAVQKNLPKSNLEYLFRKIVEGNTLLQISEGFARSKAGTTGDMAARQHAEQIFEKDGGAGSKATSVGGTVLGFVADPLTWLTAGAGSATAKGATWLGGKWLAGRGATSLAVEAATRKFSTSIGGRILTGMAAGAGNFGAYEFAKEGVNQWQWGGHINPATGENEGYSFGAMMGAGGHGLMMGAATGWIAPAAAPLSQRLTQATTSTAGKIGINAGMFGGTVLTEGTIFSIPEWIEGERDAWDVWTDNQAMMLGFKGQHVLKSAFGVLGDMKASARGEHGAFDLKGFETRLRERLDGHPELRLTEDEQRELDARGYGDLKELVADKELVDEANANRAPSSQTTEIARQGEVKGDRAEWISRLQEMMQDNSISEAARAKMYYLATGRRVPMSTVVSGSIEQDGDGYIVNTYGVNGVITSRRHKTKRGAEAEMERVNRQMEFNYVAAGEKYKDWVGTDELAKDAVDAVIREHADELGVYDNAELLRRYKMYRDIEPGERSEAEQRLVDVMDDALNERKDKFGAKAVRESVNKKYGVDIDKVLAKEPNRRSKNEQAAFEEYVRSLYPDGAFDQQADAAGDGAPDPTQPINPDQPQLTQQPTERTPYERGRDAQPEERRDIVLDMQQRGDAEAQEAYNGMVDRINDDAENEVQRLWGEYDDMRHNDGTMRPATLKLDDKPIYIVDGNVQMIEDGSMVDLEHSDKTVVVFNPETGKREMISPEAILSVDEPMSGEDIEAMIEQHRADFIQKAVDDANGTLALAPGDIVDLQTEDGGLVQGQILANDGQGGCVVALQDGTQMNVEARELQRVADDIALADYKQRNGIVDEAPVAQEVEQPVMEQETPHDYAPDTEIVIRDEDGQEKRGIVQGRVRYDAQTMQFVPDPEGQMIEYYVEGDGMKHDYPDRLDDKVVSYTPVEKPTETAEQTAQPVGDEQPTEVKAPTGPFTPENAPILDENDAQIAEYEEKRQPGQPEQAAMPMTADEEPDYYAVEPSRTHSYIYNEAGLSRSEANEHVMANYEQAQKDLTKAKAASMPKMGTSIKKFNEAKAQRQQKIDEAQKRVEYWQAVREQQQQIVTAENAERAAREAEMHDAAVEQALAEREAAKQAEAERKAVGNENPMPAITEKWNTAAKKDGATDEIVLPNGKRVSGHYVLHESGASSPSHQATAGWKQTDGFPMDVNDNTVNDRDYEHDIEAQRVTEQIAQQYDQRALQTPVVVSKDGVVLSGNGRTMAGELAAKAGTDGAYIDYLKKYAHKYGFTPEQIEAMQHPRVSFVPDEDMPYTADTFSAFNQQEMKSLSKTEQSVKLGKTVPDDTFRKVLGMMNGFDTLGDFYNDANASFNAIALMNQAGVIPQAQMAEMMDGHKLSAVGREMLENMLIGKSFENSPEVVRMLTSVPSMRQSVIFALAEISNNISLGEEFSLESELADAIKLCYEARTVGKYEHGEQVSGYARQLNLFAFEDEMQTVADINNATILMLADVLNDKRVSQLKKTLVSYNDEAANSASGQLDLFTGDIRKQEEILKDVLTLLNYGTKKDIEATQQAAIERRKAEAQSVQQDGVVEPSNQDGEQPAVEPAQEVQPAVAEETPAEIEQPAEEASTTEPTVQQAVEVAAAEVNTEPTPAQIEAGNYKKGHVTIGDFDITIENPKGSERKGVDADGKAWSVTMNNTYGYIRGTEGVDGDHIDVFLGENMDEWDGRKVFVVDQTNTDGSFDEHKCMIGFNDEESALSAYLANYSEDWQQTHPNLRITGTNIEDFNKWIQSSHRKTKAFADYASVKPTESTQLVTPRTEGYSMEKRTDTRDGSDIYAVKFEERVSRDEFKGQKEIAKRFGGYWSNFGKKGFLFKSEEAAHDFAETVMGRTVEEVEDEAPVSINDVAAVNGGDKPTHVEEVEAEEASWPKKQFEQLKAKHPDALILFHDGEGHYAAYEQDADRLSEILGMGVAHHDDGTRLAGFPTKALDAYLPRIIRAKQRVAIVDKLDDPTEKKKTPQVVEDIKPSATPTVKKVDVEGLFGALAEDGEAKLSDHATPVDEPAAEQKAEEEPKQGKSKWVEDEDAERFEELRKRLHKKLYGQLNSGFDPETFAIGAEMAYLMLKKGARKLHEFAKSMVELMGDGVRPHIKSFYDGARHMMSEDIQREMSSHEEVDAFDALNFDKQGAKDIVATAEHIANERKATEVAAEAEQQIKKKRNEEKRNKERQVAADTEAVVNEAEASASEVESKLETATTEEDANDLGRQVDEQLAKVEEQLAILGYYEAEPVEKDFNEAYGYMRNAEKKALKDATALAERLVGDLGLNLDEQTRPEKGKTKRKLAVANIAPAGGDITIRLHLNGQRDLYIDIPLSPDGYNGNLHADEIMYRLENNSGSGERYGTNNFASFNTTYAYLLSDIKRLVQDWLPQEDYVAMAQRIAAEAEQPAKPKKQGKKAAKPAGQVEMPDLFSDFFAEANKPTETSTPTNNEEVHVQPRPGKAERDGGHEPRQNEPLGKGEQHEVERPDGSGVDRRDAGDIEPNAERSGAVSDAVAEQPVTPAAPKNTRNNHAERGVDYAPKGENARIEANLKAIETMQRLVESGQQATPEDMAVLRKFSGWGGLGAAFKEKVNDPRLRREWQQDNPINKRLRELLTPEQYDAANMSRNSAYYTPAEVIEAMWDVARALGFKGGKVLEGSAGIGNIIGLMPQDMSERSDIHAVEIDDVTGNILSLLYPDAKVDVQGFEKTNVPNGSVDLAITNVPFVTGLHVLDETGDKDLSRKFRDIHDFCIAKNVRKLREGGIGIFITSSGTLDNSQKLRSWLVNEGNADVVGAFRMHNKTFGGTGATSDIIVVRKRVNGRKSANAIDVSSVGVLRTAEYTDNSGRTAKTKQLALDFNKYFIEHPEFMAGEMRFGFEEGDTFRPTSKALYPSRNGNDQGQMLREWADGLSKMDWEADKPTAEQSATVAYDIADALADGQTVCEGEMFLNKNGELCVAQRATAVPLALNANKVKGHTKAECFTAYKGIKDALAEVLEYQTNNDDDAGLQPLIKKLNAAYDAFVNTYGHLNKNTAISFLRHDMDYPSIAALESVSETGDKKGKRIVSYGKTDIFSRRVVEKESEPKPTTVKDGIIASIYLNGRVDVPYIAGQLGMSEADVRQQIVESGLGFENPTTTEMEVSYEYLSGNVREKFAQAKAHNEDGRYDANIKALERVVPMDIPAHLIEFTLGTSWLEPKMYEDYVRERTGLEKIHLYNVGGTWIMNEPYYTATEQNKAMGVRSEKLNRVVLGHELIAAALQNRTIQVSKTEKKWDGSTETITDKEATQACANKIDEIRQDFKDWARAKMQEDPELAQRIERVYNEQFNNYVPKSIPDEFVPEHFGGAARVVNGRPFQLRPHQAKAAIRATTQPLMLAHEVGTGKTYTLITTAMEMRRLGTARKPMIVVQNATVGQFVASAKALYPNAKILTLEDADRNADGRRNFYAKIRYNDWDMIVVPQSVFERIPDSEERQAKFVEDKIEEKMLVLEQMKEASENESRDPNVRQAERELENLQNELNDIRNAQLEKAKDKDEKREAKTRQNAEVQALEMLDRAVDDVANFDDMGIDALLIDEAHEYKHLGFATTMQRGVKGVDPSYSKKSQGVYLKTQAVLENNNGRNVVFATGTPISNTAAEIWTFMRYLMPADRMKEYDIYYFDDFVRNFGNIQNVLEFGASGKYKPVNRFLGYFNLPELVRVWAGVADTVLTREAGGVKEKIPDMEGGQAQDVFLPQTRALRGVMKFVKQQLDEYENMSGKQKKENSHIPLVMYGIAKAAAVDVRLVQDDAPDEPQSKTNETVRQTLRSLKETASYKGTVAIFADNYQNKNTGFNLYEDIRAKLIAAGVPEEQIVVMKSGMTVKKKLEIFDRVNRGEVRVVMGSTFTLGTGVNIQERLHTLIHVDAPNRPMDYTQRNGRILRQGNLHRDWNKPVRVLRFGVEDSLDVTAYQRLKTKGAIADSIMEGKKMVSNAMENRALEEEQDVFGDITAQLSGSQYALLKNQMEKEVKKLQAKRKQWEADQTYIHNQKPRLQGQIRKSEEWKAENEEALQKLNAAGLGDKITENGAPVIKIGELEFDGLEAMTEFIKDFNKKQHEIQEQVRSSHSYDEKQTRKLTISVGGIDFVLTSTIGKELKNNQGTFFASATTSMTYSCPELGLVDVPVTGQKIKSALEDIMQNVVTGDDFRDKVERAERMAERYRGELAQIEKREGVPFQFDKELAEAEAKLEEYEALMQKEMEEKEAKYAEVDAEVEAATGVQLSDEEDDAAGSEDSNRYRIREDEPPTNTGIGYKVFVLKDGKLYPPMVANPDGAATPTGVWLDADAAPVAGESKTGRLQVAAGGKGTQGGSGRLAYRPGWHLGEIPYALQFNRLNPETGERELFPANFVWAEVEYSNDVDYQDEAMSYGMNANGKFQHSLAGLPYLPKNGAYRYRTNPNPETDPWIITGAMRVNRILKPSEVDAMVEAAGREPQQRQDGAVTDEMVEALNKDLTRRMNTDKDAIRQEATMLASSYHTPIEIVEDVNTLTAPGNPKKQARMRKAKGWYDTKSGKIVVVMPNNHNVEDVAATMFHEVVAHKGLRELIGEDGYNDFLREVYEHCTEEVRKRIAEKAHKHGWNFEKATDEYLGDLSEKGFEDFDKGERTLWQKLKAKVLEAINKFLKSLKLPKWVKLGDNELRYMLWRSHKNLQRGKEDVIEQAQDIVKRGELGLGREAFRMGDEPSTFAERQKQAEANKGTVMPGLNDAEVKVVDIPRHSYTGDIKEATRQAAEAAKAKYAPDGKAVTLDYNNHGVSFQYEISGSAIDEALNPKQQNKSSNKGAHLSIIEHLDEIIGESIEAEEHPDYLKDKETGERSVVNPVALMHRFYGAAEVDGQTYRVMTIMREDKRATEANGVHAYEVTKVELLDNEPSSSSGTGTSNVKALVPVSVAKLLQNVEKAYDKGKKLLEESQILDENDGLLFRDPGETGDIWSDASMGFEERMTAAATRLANNHADDKRLKNDAMRAIGGNLANLRKAMSLQRNFDITTVKRVADLARILMNNGFLTGLNQQEVKRLLAAVKNSTGHEDVAASVQKVLDIMVDNQLSHAKQTLHQLITIKGSKVDAKGVEVQGQLDPDGARTMQVFKKAHTLPEEDINQRIAEALNRMSSTDNAVADEAAIEYAGLNLALEYVQNIAASVAEEKELRDDLKQHAEAASARDKATDAYRQYVESMQEAIRKNKTERVEAYYQLVGRMSDALRESLANAADFREAEKQRVREIQHNANSDMEGRPSDEHHKTTWKEKFVNNSFVSFGFAPLATFDQMLRMFGSKSANGEGYLYNRFMRGWVDAREQEIKGVKAKYAILDAKAAEVFGKRGMKWGDLISMERKMPKASVSFWNGGEMQERELSQGNLLYIYMVNKMLDGRIKLRKMGITEQDVENIVDVLDPRFVQLADWLQDEFLVDTRNEYNETHKRMFGASMAAIENYFPLKILANARADKPEDLDNPREGEGISTTTGSIIKRRRNALALDITGADAFSVILDHVAQMEHWNAYAEWNRDLNTLRTYRRFRNQVQNMTSVYGGGKELWKKFNDVCQMAAGTYRPPRAKLDEAAVNFAKGVTAAKVSFRIFTALKQLLSMPAYLPEARPDHMLADLVNPIGAWRWSMENLPIFKERWASRMSGDPRLLKSDMDWKLWRSRIMEISSRLGMSPNAFVDALTVSIGAHSMYKTRKGQYISDGYSDEDADRMAKQDATILFNQTQQSSEGPFTSTMQVDRSWLSVLFTVFRNASMSYTRQLYDAVRNMKRNLTPGQRAESIVFMAKQMERDGIDADKARKSAGKKFNRQLLRDALRIGVFGYVMQLAWNLGAYLPYILFGDDDDEKQKMWDDVWAHTAFGSIEGLTGGDLMSQAGAMMVTGEGNPAYLSKDMPLTGDIMTALQKIGRGQTEEALSDMINLVVQSGIGVNPQSITDGVLAIMDACGDDPELAHEATICVMRILQVPQSQIDKMYFDEIGLSGDEVSNYTPAQLAERYAHYKVKRGRLYAPWSWDDAEATAKQTKKADTAIKERLDRLGDADANTAYQELEADYKEMSQLFTAFNKAKKAGNAEEATRIGTELQSDPARYQTFVMFKKLDGKLDDLVDYYLKSESADEANLCKQALIDFKAGMVRAIQATDEASRATEIGRLSDMMSDFVTKYKGFRGAANQ